MSEEALNVFYVADENSKGLSAHAWQNSDSLQPQTAKPRILVVDDHRLIADTICDILESSGFHGIAAYDGLMALDMMRRFHPEYLLSDVLMPKMNGVQLAITVRKTYPGTRILLFSGQAGISEILQDGHKQGYEFELMPKPIHPTKLIERIKELK